ncbi:hypothetical protein BaRGS_00018761 [Batillaria attramentaria]|uniref:Uncharacterized protein n=1 Tax=Batillaria attramentaria TaxID=370345 RepID=A0ABD0KS18_9CAEN
MPSLIPSLSHLTLCVDKDGSWMFLGEFYDSLRHNHKPGDCISRKDNLLRFFKRQSNLSRPVERRVQVKVCAVLKYCFSNSDTSSFCQQVTREVENCVVCRSEQDF